MQAVNVGGRGKHKKNAILIMIIIITNAWREK